MSDSLSFRLRFSFLPDKNFLGINLITGDNASNKNVLIWLHMNNFRITQVMFTLINNFSLQIKEFESKLFRSLNWECLCNFAIVAPYLERRTFWLDQAHHILEVYPETQRIIAFIMQKLLI